MGAVIQMLYNDQQFMNDHKRVRRCSLNRSTGKAEASTTAGLTFSFPFSGLRPGDVRDLGSNPAEEPSATALHDKASGVSNPPDDSFEDGSENLQYLWSVELNLFEIRLST